MKEQLVAESVRLFEQRGFTNTSLQDIVEALGVTKGTFYYYFPTKEALLMTIHESYIESLLDRQQRVLAQTKDVRTQLRHIVQLLIEDIQTHGQQGRVFFREIRHLDEANGARIRDKRRQFRIVLEQVIANGVENHTFRHTLRPDMTAFAILGMTNYSYQWYQPDGEMAPQDLADYYVTLLLDGMEERP